MLVKLVALTRVRRGGRADSTLRKLNRKSNRVRDLRPRCLARSRTAALETHGLRRWLPLRHFFRELADDWRGDRPERAWRSIENDLVIDARRDSLGHLYLTFVLRESYRPEAWQAQVTIQVEAGEEMASLAAATDRLLSD